VSLATAVVGLAVGTAAALVGATDGGWPALAAEMGVPIVIVCLFAAGASGWSLPIVLASFVLDVEAVLLGFAPLTALPFVAALPLVGVALAMRVLPPARLLPVYFCAWLGSSLGFAIALASQVSPAEPTALFALPTFALIDALALGLLWRLDADRLAALKAVVEAEAVAHDLLQQVDLVGVKTGRDSKIEFVNDYFLRVTGWERDEILGRNWWDTFATPERREAARANWSETVRSGGSLERRRESFILTRSGQRIRIRWSHVTLHDATGTVTGLASLGEDVTAARAADEELRRTAELLSRVVMSSPLATVVVGMDRNVQLWNPAIAELLGWREEEVLGRQLPRVLGSQSRWPIARVFLNALRGDAVDHQLLEVKRRDGRTVAVRLYGGALRDRDGLPISVAIQAVDVTAALAMEEQLREAQKMEAVGRLAGGVAHDFNNSLTAIAGFASLIATESAEPDSREAAETILAASKRAADLTRELLAYSRRSLLQPQTIDVNSLVGAVRPMLMPLLGEDVSVVIESRVSAAMVRVDPSGLERVILNLAANARDAMPRGGRLSIVTDRRDRDCANLAAGTWVVITVSDNGSGIPSELQSRVFDPFFTTKPVGSGTGLGLAMVKGFVVQSGGLVGLVSSPTGTSIEILLPEVTGSQPPAPDAAPSAFGHGETVLLVEDDPTVAVMGFQVLSRRGYRVLLADTGESATALIHSHSGAIGLLLVDVVLPDMRGPELVADAVAVHPEAAVLYASGYSTEAIGRAGELSADVDLIEKPYTPDELLARVREAIDRAATKAAPADGVAAASD
jgi:PAS domain S-box-containing protein